MAALLIAAAEIDRRHGIIPNRLLAIGAGLALALAPGRVTLGVYVPAAFVSAGLSPGRYRLEVRGSDDRAVPPSYAAPEGHVRLSPNGELIACHCGTGRVGSLRKQSFPELWSSDAARHARDLAERCPGCWGASAKPEQELVSALA